MKYSKTDYRCHFTNNPEIASHTSGPENCGAVDALTSAALKPLPVHLTG